MTPADADPSPHLSPAAADWLRAQAAKVAGGDRRALALGFGLAPRKVGKGELAGPFAGWSADQAARRFLLLSFPTDDEAAYLAAFDALAGAAEVGELVTLYRSLPDLPFSAALADRAAEGLRTHVQGVFEAIAHRNPFPAKHFSDARWNQMVLKALFIGSPLAPIVGLRGRMNDDLRVMLSDYRAEREAAGRDVPGELLALLGEA